MVDKLVEEVLDAATPGQIERANAAVEANLIDGLPRYESAQGYACALTAIIEGDAIAQKRVNEALLGATGIASGPDGNGGMRVVVHFAEPGQETALFHLLNAALPTMLKGNGDG